MIKLIHKRSMGNTTQSESQLRDGSVVIITGASSGLGKQLALNLCERRLRIIITGRDQPRLNQTKLQCVRKGQAEIMLFVGDITLKQDCEALIKLAIQNFNQITCLILNAGINAHFQFKDLKNIEIFETLMKTNFYANVQLTKIALPFLKKSHGKIVVISSLSGKFGLPSRSAYCASKFALTGFFESLRTQVDIGIIMVYPTSLNTGMREKNVLKQLKVELAPSSSSVPSSSASSSSEKREDPKKCAEMIINAINTGKQDVYLPMKGLLGIVLQPLFPNFIRQKLKKAAKL